MTKWFLLFAFAVPLAAQITSLTATITDSTSQAWANGSYSIQFLPVPNRPNNYSWQGAPFVPQLYTGAMDGTGTLSVTLPDNNTITPAGTQWQFTLCSNTSAPCTTLLTPVTGASEDLSSFFSSRVTAPSIFTSAIPRAYSAAEVTLPPPNQGGAYYNVTANQACFWTGSVFYCLAAGGTVSSVGFSLPTSVFICTGSPVTSSGTITCAFGNQVANSVFAGPVSGGPGVPSFRALAADDIPSLPYIPSSTTLYYQTVEANATAAAQEPKLNLISGANATVSCIDNSGASRTDCTVAATASLAPNPNTPTLSFSGGAAGSLIAGSNDGAGSVDVTTGNSSGGTLLTLTFGGTYSNPMFCTVSQLVYPAWAAGVFPSNPGSLTELVMSSTSAVPSGIGFVNYLCHQ